MSGRALLLAAVFGSATALACGAPAPGSAWRARHPDYVRAAPDADAELGAVLASLEQEEPDVTLTSLRMLDLSADPWQELDGEAELLESVRGDAPHALLAERECRRPGLASGKVRHASWLLFRGGRLLAWDHPEFDVDCVPTHRFQPAPQDWAAYEEHLERSRARRFPGTGAHPEAIFRRGLAYLEHGRPEAAADALARGDRALEAAKRQDSEAGADASLATARSLRKELSRALRRQRGLDADPSERFWKGSRLEPESPVRYSASR